MIGFSRLRGGAALLIFAFFFAPVSSARAEVKFPDRPLDTTSLEKMRGGTNAQPPSSPKSKELLGDLAKWLAWRLVHPPFNGVEPKVKMPGLPEDIETLMTETEKWLSWPNPRAKPNEQQLEYAREFGQALESEIKYVMSETTNKLERVNAARMLSLIGKAPYEGIATTYLEMIRDDKTPLEIKLFAFQGMRNLLSLSDPSDPNRHIIKTNKVLADISNELEKFITRKHPATVSGEDARVIQFVRREAVRALAHMKNSVIRQQQEAIAKPICTLLRVATNDKFVKPGEVALAGFNYHILERIEAVIGICSMLPDRALNLDMVVYLVNEALLDISLVQTNERTLFQSDPRNKPLVPWKISAARMSEAMKAWKANTEKLPPARNPTYVSSFVDEVQQKFLNKLELTGVESQPDSRPFTMWKGNAARKPKTNLVLADDESTAVELK